MKCETSFTIDAYSEVCNSVNEKLFLIDLTRFFIVQASSTFPFDESKIENCHLKSKWSVKKVSR